MTSSLPARARVLAWGALVALLYLAVAAVTFAPGGRPVRPLFDGPHTPLPYRWVSPPPDLAATNLPAQFGVGSVSIGPKGSNGNSVRTDDFQAGVVLPTGIFTSSSQKKVKVTIEPLDPNGLAIDPPKGLEYQGNAYRFTATYAPSGRAATLPAKECDPTAKEPTCVTIFLRSPFGASGLLRQDGDAWAKLDATEAQLDIFADSPAMGVFVAVAPPGKRGAQAGTSTSDFFAIALGGLAILGGAAFYRTRLKAQREALVRRAAGKKYKGPPGKGAKGSPPKR